MTLIRFDEVYVVYFKTNGRSISTYPNILNYCRDLYQIPGISESINMQHIKTHYFTSHSALNTYAISKFLCHFISFYYIFKIIS